jgi:hypothetical protein
MQKSIANRNTGMSDEQRYAEIDSARNALDIKLSELSAQEIYTIWCMELTDTQWAPKYVYGRPVGRTYFSGDIKPPQGTRTYKANNPNNAFYAVTSKFSPLMKLLGFTASEGCGWLNDDAKVAKYIGWCKQQDNPYLALTKVIAGNQNHALEVLDGNGEGVVLGDCPECVTRLKEALVKSIRSDIKNCDEHFAKGLIRALKFPVRRLVEKDVLVNEDQTPELNAEYIDDYNAMQCMDECNIDYMYEVQYDF